MTPSRFARGLAALVAYVLVAAVVAGCAAPPIPTPVVVPTAVPTAAPARAKYVFLFVGDGMGVVQRNAAELFLATRIGAGERPEETKLAMNDLPAQGMCTTYDLSSVIPDSASTATALVSGKKTLSGVIGMDQTKKQPLRNIAEMARDAGWKVGVVTTVSIDHATPAAFYAHMASRNDYYTITLQLADSGYNYFAGGGVAYPTGRNKDQADAYGIIASKGYKMVTTRAEFEKLTPADGKVYFRNEKLQDSSACYYTLDGGNHVTLAEMVKKGIELLDNPKGFLMGIEAGKIDWACHANDAGSAIWDTLALDYAVIEALKFYDQHPDETLIIVTGDHETGGMTIGFAGTQYNSFVDKIASQTMSYVQFSKELAEFKKTAKAGETRLEQAMPLIQRAFGLRIMAASERAALEAKVKDSKDPAAAAALSMALSDLEIGTLAGALDESLKDVKLRASNEQTYLLYGGYEPLAVKCTTILNQKAGLSWTSYSHTGTPVQVSARGVGSEQFNGYYDQTDIFLKMIAATGLQ